MIRKIKLQKKQLATKVWEQSPLENQLPSYLDIHNISEKNAFVVVCPMEFFQVFVQMVHGMGKPCSCTKFIKAVFCTASHARIRIRYYKSHENPYQVLQVTCAAYERAMKSEVHMIKLLSP